MLSWQHDVADDVLVEAGPGQVELRVVPWSPPCPPRWQRALRRAISLAVAVPAAIMLTPLVIAIATLVKLTSDGPVLFRHVRVSRGGSTFTMLKFRTMREGTVEWIRQDPQRWAAYTANGYKAPPEFRCVTPLGKVLRKTSLDEIPQLYNVLRGEMSIVGVRPRVPSEYRALPERSRVLYALFEPGMTGLWQVKGRSTLARDDRLSLEDHYVAHWNPWRDVVLIARTPAAVARIHEAA